MAKKEPNKPEDIKTGPATEQAMPDKTGPEALEITAEEAAVLGHEGTAAMHDIGDDGLEPPTPFDIPAPGEVVVPFDKINEIVSGKQAAAREAEQAAQDKAEPEAPAPETKPRRGRPPKADKAEKEPKPEKTAKPPKAPKKAPAKEETPAPEPEQPPEPKEAPRKGEQEQIVFINLSELHAFKDHPFQVRQDEEMAAMVESVRDKGVTQPAIVRPREGGGYEIVSGHRRQTASELAGYAEMPCIVRNLTDEEAITQMVEDNTNQRENILPSERAKALKMQLDAIKQQGARTGKPYTKTTLKQLWVIWTA